MLERQKEELNEERRFSLLSTYLDKIGQTTTANYHTNHVSRQSSERLLRLLVY